MVRTRARRGRVEGEGGRLMAWRGEGQRRRKWKGEVGWGATRRHFFTSVVGGERVGRPEMKMRWRAQKEMAEKVGRKRKIERRREKARGPRSASAGKKRRTMERRGGGGRREEREGRVTETSAPTCGEPLAR
jgi:hypothetical protein